MKPKLCLGCNEEVLSHHSVYAKMMSLMHRGFILPLFTLRWHELCWVDKVSEVYAKNAAQDAQEELEKGEGKDEHRG